jgi:hypothetical protein
MLHNIKKMFKFIPNIKRIYMPLKRYIATYNKDNKIVLSQVDKPAMEGVNVYLSKEDFPKMEVALSEEGDKQIIYCVALSPHIEVYRNEIFGDKGSVIWPADVIELTANDFITQGQTLGGTLDHSEKTNDIRVVQSWVVTDPENDKAIALGMENIKGGEWIVGQEVLSVELWEECKAGNYNGISIEGMFGMVQLSEQKNTFESLINQFLINK